MKQTENLSYWEDQARDIEEEELVTHRDRYQKLLELEIIRPFLKPEMRVLDVGCGNGYTSEFMVDHVAMWTVLISPKR